MSTVNIILATYNGECFLREQIDSILASTYTDWSLAVFDDGSTDGTVEIVKQYTKKYPERIFLFCSTTNQGHAVNFLRGLKTLCDRSNDVSNEEADDETPSWLSSNQVKYFMFCDQDDVWQRDKIERTLHRIKVLEKKYGKSSPALVFTDAELTDENLCSLKRTFFGACRLRTKDTRLGNLLMENKCMGCTIMVNHALASRVKAVPCGARYHDWWLALIAASFGHISFLPEVTMSYRQHSSNVVGGASYSYYFMNRIANFKELKRVLLETQLQAEEFLCQYEDELDECKQKIIRNFANLHRRNWFVRRYQLLRYGFFKSGILRNIGLFIVI